MPWWRKKLPLAGSVLFRGDLPPKPEEFGFLENHGIDVKQSQTNDPSGWCLELTHPEWGTGRLMCSANAPLPPKELFQFAFIPEADREAASSARSLVALRMESRHEHVLRDRKLMLRFLRAVMGDDGVVAVDMVSQKVWTRTALDDELIHDADLDVEGIYNLEAVSDESGEVYWVHTHGLSEVGGFDFDVFEPSSEVSSGIHDLARALAFHILEGAVGPSAARFPLVYPRGEIRLVEMDYFLAHTDPARRERLSSWIDESHRKNRSVLCEPEGSVLGRLLGGKTLQPVRFLSREIPENPVFNISTPATELMAERARKTYPVLRKLREEFAQYPFPCIVKLGIRTDGGSETDREHMWFEAHELFEDSIDATLANRPYNVSGMKEGDRGRHSIDLISDWTMITPAGMINPRSMDAARMLRENPEVLAKLLEAMNKEGGGESDQ